MLNLQFLSQEYEIIEGITINKIIIILNIYRYYECLTFSGIIPLGRYRKIRSKTIPINKDLWKKLKNLSSKHSIKWVWVKGHAHNKYNNLVDEIAQEAIKK